MTKIISTSEVNRLAKLAELESKLNNAYLTDLTDKQTELLVNFFYKNEDVLQQQRKIELLNLSLSYPSLICRTVADYTGDGVNTLEMETWETIYNLTWAGHAVYTYGLDESEELGYYIKEVSPDSYVRGNDGEEIILTYFQKESNDKIQTYVLKRTYTLGNITNELYLLKNTLSVDVKGDIKHTLDGALVPLNTLAETEDLKEEETTGFDFNPIVVGSIGKGFYGTSLIEEVLPLARSLEMNLFNLQDQFFKHLQAKITVPQSNRPLNPNESFSVRNEEVITVAAGEHIPTYLTNDNKMISHFFEYFETVTRQISAITGIPVDFLGLKSAGGAESATAKQLKLSKFIKRIENSRKVFVNMLNEVQEGLEKMGVRVDELSIDWDSIFPTNKLDEAKELEIAKGSCLISDIKAIMRYQDISEEEAMKELALINKANADVDLDSLMETSTNV